MSNINVSKQDNQIVNVQVNTKKDKSYIHKNVPIQVWNEFKKATSFGKFYNRNIKGVYQM
jgi:hypothetical protein